MVYETKKRNPIPFVVLLVGIIAVALTPAPLVQGLHFLNHRENSISALSNCTPDNPTFTEYYNPDTQRYGYICQDENGKWLVVIFCAITGAIITAFKNKHKKKEKVDRYMQNAGYKH